MAKMRSVQCAYNQLCMEDPETAMTISGLRRLVKTGAIPSVRIGRRILINYDRLIEYLNNPPMQNKCKKEDDAYGQIRKINVR